jgi:hypothetical protein
MLIWADRDSTATVEAYAQSDRRDSTFTAIACPDDFVPTNRMTTTWSMPRGSGDRWADDYARTISSWSLSSLAGPDQIRISVIGQEMRS